MNTLDYAYHWTIAYRKGIDENFKTVNNPDWAWCADPFLVEYKGDIYLFAEAFLYKTERKGVIAYCKFDGDRFGDWIVTMDKKWHLSYPNVFVMDGELYMCPESYQNYTVSLYRLIEFPDKWERVSVLLDNVTYADTTFFSFNNKQYLITFDSYFHDSEGRTLVYVKDNGCFRYEGVISDNKSNARPGGNIIENDGKIYRIGQNSEELYGGGLTVMEIESWFPTYKEHEVKKVFPEDISIENTDKYCGIHTYNRLGDLEVIDLKYKEYFPEERVARERVRKIYTDKFRKEW